MRPLIINHKIYGRHKITEPILIELINSKALKRLKGVGQNGAWDFHQSCPGRLSRYQHSIGVMLLLRKYNAPLEEQIAGLLHDISHTAFSHVADFVFDSHYLKHNYQDSKLAQAFKLQGVNKILKKYNIKPSYILNEKNFPLLERNLPDLCADRLDYTFQDDFGKKLTTINPKDFLKNLIVYKNQFVFASKDWAKKFGKFYLKLNQNVWCSPIEASLYKILAQAIKAALKKEIINKKDLFKTDKFVMKKLKESRDPKILENLEIIKNLKVKTVPKNQADFFTRSKPRVVDPYFLKNGKLVRLTVVDKTYKKEIDKWSKQAKKGFWIKILTS